MILFFNFQLSIHPHNTRTFQDHCEKEKKSENSLTNDISTSRNFCRHFHLFFLINFYSLCKKESYQTFSYILSFTIFIIIFQRLFFCFYQHSNNFFVYVNFASALNASERSNESNEYDENV